MKTLKSMAVILIAMGLLAGCGSKPAATTIQTATDDAIKTLPDWFMNPPTNDETFSYATATAASRDLQLALDKAKATALNTLAQSRETHVSGLQKRFQEEVGTQADAQILDQFSQTIKTVTSTTLNGVSKMESSVKNDNGMFRAYVLWKLDLGASSKRMLEEIKKEEELYTRFRASQAFEDLEKEVEKYENR